LPIKVLILSITRDSERKGVMVGVSKNERVITNNVPLCARERTVQACLRWLDANLDGQRVA